MRKLLSLTLLGTMVLLGSLTAGAQVRSMLVGTTTEGSTSEGIYLCTFDEETGVISTLSSVKTPNPTFVIVSPDADYVYSVNEYNDGRQAVSSFSLKDDTLTQLSTRSTDFGEISGGNPCNLLLVGNNLVSSNYSGGTVSVFPIGRGGRLDPPTQCYQYSEIVTRKVLWNQKKSGVLSHMHCAVLSPDGKYVFVTNLGADCIHRFTIAEGEEPLVEDGVAFQYERRRQAGPRHMVFSKDGRYAYLLCELDDILTVFKYNDGTLEELQTISAYDGKGHGSADIHLSPDGNFLYTSHRLAGDGVAIFHVDKVTGKVRPMGYQPTGIHPRNFAISPSGKWLLVACRDSNVVEVYSRSSSSGQLKKEGEYEFGKPMCVQFF